MLNQTLVTLCLAGATLVGVACVSAETTSDTPRSPVVDTGQERTFGTGREIVYPQRGQDYFGQDAQYEGNSPRYKDNGNGTVTDLVTQLTWQKTPDYVKRTQDDAERYAAKLKLSGHDDWRVPTMKELFSIAIFRGNMHTRTPYIDTQYFDFKYPSATEGASGKPGHRNMDAQYCTTNRYLGITMGRDKSAFGFNFADGRIKSYPLHATRYVRCVRGKAYGQNMFVDNGDGTITDKATSLTWQKVDSGKTMDWKQALKYAQSLELAGHDDWRLPNVKELQSIVDYDRAPDALDRSKKGPAINPIFGLTTPESWFWSGTTHIENQFAYYVCFGQSFSTRMVRGLKINAHGAGAVRSDPKEGDPGRWPNGLGPQADEIRINNYVRCVRGGAATLQTKGPALRPGSTSPTLGQQPRQASPKDRFIQRLDKNGDGKISEAEFDGPARHFKQLDKNGDGFLTGSEAPKGPPSDRPERTPPNNRRRSGNSAQNDKEVPVVLLAAQAPDAHGKRRPPSGKGHEHIKKPRITDTIKANMYADNSFKMYINGRLVAVDSIKFIPHNVIAVDILPQYPMMIAVMALDNADAKTGMEFQNAQIGDGGFILKFADGTVTNSQWKAKKVSWGPLNHDTKNPKVVHEPIPENWYAVDFDDKGWQDAKEYTEEQVGPKSPYYEHDFKGAKFIWTDDLELDNTVLFRFTVKSAPDGSKPKDWSAIDNPNGDEPATRGK